MCQHWLPDAPEGCGFHPTRCSQDPVEAWEHNQLLPWLDFRGDLWHGACCCSYFSYVRSAGGSSHPAFAECITAGAGRSTNQTMASSANNGDSSEKWWFSVENDGFWLKIDELLLKMMCFLLELVNLQRQDGHTHAGPFLNNELFNENDELFIKNDELYIQNDVFKLIVCLRRTRWNLKKPPSARLQR